MSRSLLVALFTFLLSVNAFAKDSFDYPELVVSPSASERVKMLAKDYQDRNIFSPTMLQISAVTTLVSGILQQGEIDENNDPDKISGIVGMAVGATWLGFNYLTFNKNNYFLEGYNRIKAMPEKTKAQKLAKERIAEEIIRDRVKLMKRISYVSALTNFGAAIFMQDNVIDRERDPVTNQEVKKISAAKISHILVMATSLLPIIFESEEEKVWTNHQQYKKKIYGPIVRSDLLFDQVSGTLVPGMRVSYRF